MSRRKQGRVMRVGKLFDEVVNDFKQRAKEDLGFEPSDREVSEMIGKTVKEKSLFDDKPRRGMF